MNGPGPNTNDNATRLARRLKRLFGWTHLALVWEKLWRNLWPLFTVAALFLSVAFFDLLPSLPYWAHWCVLLGFAILGEYQEAL